MNQEQDGGNGSADPVADETFREMVEVTPAAVTVLMNGTVVYANSAAEDLLGLSRGALPGKHVLEFVDPEATVGVRDQLARSSRGGDAGGSFETLLIRADGARVRVESLAHRVHWGGQQAISLISHDITARVQRETELRFAATHDPLTGLANRTLLLDRLELAMARIGRSCAGVFVLLMDLDGFKAINDTHGHLAGDQVLRQVATRLRGALRAGDTVARLAGDEFVVCVDLDEPHLSAAAIRRRVEDALSGPYHLNGTPIVLTAGIGSMTLTQRSDALAVIAQADSLMYVKKRSRRRR